MIFRNLNIRPRLLIGIGSASIVVVIFVALIIVTLFNEITQDTLPELRSLQQLDVTAHQLVAEYNEYLLGSDEESINDIDAHHSELDITLKQYSVTAAQEEDEAGFITSIALALSELQNRGSAVIESQNQLDKQLEVLERMETEFRLLFDEHGSKFYAEENQITSVEDKQLLTIRLLITELHLENLEYTRSREDKTLQEIRGIQTQLSNISTQLSVNKNGASDHSKLIVTIAKLGLEFWQKFDQILLLENQLIDRRELLDQAAESLSTRIAEANRTTIKEAKDVLFDTLINILLLAIFMPLMLGGVMWLITSHAIEPLFALNQGAKSIGKGDLSARVKVESNDEFGELTSSFNQMAENLQASISRQGRLERLSALGKIAGTISHELRNPLGTIRTTVFNIKDRMENEGINWGDHMLQRVERNLERCNNIISSLLDFVRQRPLDLKPTEIDLWLPELLEETGLPAGITLKYDLSCGTQVSIDQELLRRAVLNIYQNACQAMIEIKPGHEQDSKSKNLLTCSTSLNRDKLNLVFEDSGPGISPEIIGDIFEPLFSTKTFGVGLGMSVVKQIMEQHDGGVEIDSKIGRGTRVTLWLPNQ